ncbi:hypothetical protein [Granulicella aggregans]|uniref:hypothetical protein n=1 Tax=Granulicella aggregans TaxID=474949 RepID=UPI0021DF62C2|nr:hypothetical protein [Granulicella aggregans]
MTANSKAKTTIFAGVLLLGNAVPTVARAQYSPPLMQVRNPDSSLVVVAKPMNGSYALFDTKHPQECIGTFNPRAFLDGKDTLTPAGLSNAAELQKLNDASPQAPNGQHMLQMTLYKGPAVQVGVCNIGQFSANSAATAQQTTAPPATGQQAYADQMNAAMNTVRIMSYKITKADEKNLQIEISDSLNRTYTMKIEPASTLSAMGSSMRNSARGVSDGNLGSWKGKSIKVSIGGSFAEMFNGDGTRQVQSEKGLGSGSVTATMRNWNESDMKKMFGEAINRMPTAIWVPVAQTLETKVLVPASAPVGVGGQSEVVQPAAAATGPQPQ